MHLKSARNAMHGRSLRFGGGNERQRSKAVTFEHSLICPLTCVNETIRKEYFLEDVFFWLHRDVALC